MNIIVNGQAMVVPPTSTVASLIEQLALGPARVAVERNAAIVPRSQHAHTALCEGDQLEIVKAVGGG